MLVSKKWAQVLVIGTMETLAQDSDDETTSGEADGGVRRAVGPKRRIAHGLSTLKFQQTASNPLTRPGVPPLPEASRKNGRSHPAAPTRPVSKWAGEVGEVAAKSVRAAIGKAFARKARFDVPDVGEVKGLALLGPLELHHVVNAGVGILLGRAGERSIIM
jgi:hypothetical protein